jgi:NhaA family Na+:H+ antiporter
MLVPAGIFTVQLWSIARRQVSLWLLISLCIGNLILIRNRVPLSLKIFLTALAVIDDLGRLWLCHTHKTILWSNLFYALGTMLILFVLNRMKVKI